MTDVIAREKCVILDREALLSIEDGMAVLRVAGKGETAVHLGYMPDGAIRIGLAFIRAGLQHKGSVTQEQVLAEIDAAFASAPRKLRLVGGDEA
jgi:hypothetical protein